jgi:hypothetical protein
MVAMILGFSRDVALTSTGRCDGGGGELGEFLA